MKARDCLEIGRDCGLDTVGEAFLNIVFHAMNIFEYEKEEEEIGELIRSYKNNNLKKDMSINKVLEGDLCD